MAGVSERGQGATERLKPVRGIEVIWRGVYEVDHAGHHYAVEVDYFDFAEKVRLYRDGTRVNTRKSPARFEIDGGAAIEASMGLLGMKTLRLIEPGGETALTPAEGVAEARRADFERRNPRVSRIVGVLAWLVLVIALIIEIPEIIRLIGDAVGFEFTPPIQLSPLANGLLGVLALAAALDRALLFKSNRWLD
jgi:hypothetical protein